MTKIIFIVMIILIGLTCAVICFNNWSLSSSYSRDVIRLADGSKVYVMLEEWALHDKLLFITQNPCGCRPANPDTDYISKSLGYDWLDYKVTDKGLVIFGWDIYWREPNIPWTKNKPVFELPKSDMREHPEAYGITALRRHSGQWCFLNLFRPSSSLRPDIFEREWKVNPLW